eukprot:6197078-Prymnesium_polylepis.1
MAPAAVGGAVTRCETCKRLRRSHAVPYLCRGSRPDENKHSRAVSRSVFTEKFSQKTTPPIPPDRSEAMMHDPCCCGMAARTGPG